MLPLAAIERTTALDRRVVEKLGKARAELDGEGLLISRERLAACHALFRERFGPDRLGALSGMELLDTMHLHGSKDSLVYWLEFKNDEELPDAFGSIAGGSALKFGIYKRKETGTWMTGSALAQTELSVEKAVAVAERHRDQLVAASRLIADLATGASDADYVALQVELDAAAPDVRDTGWAHKYFSLVFPDKVDWFHSETYQRFNLVRMLQVPPGTPGRFAPAGRFVAAAAELDMPLAQLGPVLNRANGRPYFVWRVGTRVTINGQDGVSIWPSMRASGTAAIGWDDLGNLARVERKKESKDWLKQHMAATYPGTAANVSSRKAGEVFDFVANLEEGDLVLASDGERLLGVGRVKGGYAFLAEGNPGGHHRRPVEWLETSEWSLPDSTEGKLTTFFPIRRPENVVAVESRILPTSGAEPPPNQSPIQEKGMPVRLSGIPGRLQSILERKGQVILYGPPGTGKTFWGMTAAREIAALSAFKRCYLELDVKERETIDGGSVEPGLVRACTFHPGYGYEDFIEGYRPTSSASGQLSFEQRDGTFKRLCSDAKTDPAGRDHVLFIDEINRGDIPRIFGELITLLEMDKRGAQILLPISGERFSVPHNVKIIGTMNTADRSVALLDAALRRRFGFLELMPDVKSFGDAAAGGVPLGQWLAAVNARIREHVGRDARNLQIGHSYLFEGGKPLADRARLAAVIAEEIVPLVEEYCYEDYGRLEAILGSRLVDRANQRVRAELFEPARLDDLMTALLQLFPELATSGTAVSSTPSLEPGLEPDVGEAAS